MQTLKPRHYDVQWSGNVAARILTLLRDGEEWSAEYAVANPPRKQPPVSIE